MNLVEDLRSRGWRQQGKPPCGGILMQQAADRIEQLEAALRDLISACEFESGRWGSTTDLEDDVAKAERALYA